MYLKEKVLKYSLLALEILSSLISLFFFLFLLFYMVKLRFTDFSTENLKMGLIHYNYTIEEKGDYNVKISPYEYKEIGSNINEPTAKNTSIIFLSKSFVEKHSSNVIESIEAVESCYFFSSDTITVGLQILGVLDKATSSFFDISITLVLLIFCVSMKINLVFQTMRYLKEMDLQWRKKYFAPFFTVYFTYNFIIYFFYFINLRALYNFYFIYRFDDCLGFSPISYDNFYYDRMFIRSTPEPDFLLNNGFLNDYDIFLLNSKDGITHLSTPSTALIIFFLCVFIAVSRYFVIFNPYQKARFVLLNETDSFLKKISQVLTISFLVFVWIFFSLYGLLYLRDNFRLSLGYMLFDPTLRWRTWNFIFLSGIQVPLYLIIFCLSIINKILKIKRTVNQLKNEITPDTSLEKSHSFRTVFSEYKINGTKT